MKDVLPAASSGFDRPATYRIKVRGRIPPKWCDCLQGMTVTECRTGAGPPTTTLDGELADQAALAGLLDTLFLLHLSVLSVECLSADDAFKQGETP
jgi:hypothetical protein